MTQPTQQQQQHTPQQDTVQPQDRKPHEHVGIVFSETLTIRDPNSGEIVLQQRCS